MEISSAHEAQSILVQDLHKKADKLKRVEEVCRRQETVIESLEKVRINENKKGISNTLYNIIYICM